MRKDKKGRTIFPQRATSIQFARSLQENFNWFSSVPDSVFRNVLPELSNYSFAPRENTAIGMAFGAKIAGRKPAVLLQNSGLGLCLDAILGTFGLFRKGLLLVVSNRGVLEWEEVQHKDWGEITSDFLNAARIPHFDFNTIGFAALEEAARMVIEHERVVAITVQRGNLDE